VGTDNIDSLSAPVNFLTIVAPAVAAALLRLP
jgi:hypothetical protein